MKLGMFMMPMHPLHRNPTETLQEDRQAVILADQVVTMTPRPGRVADIVDVALPRPRSFTQVSTEEFARCAERIRSHIFGRPIPA